jgi:Skp family chaperone for outer membrane proteins
MKSVTIATGFVALFVAVAAASLPFSAAAQSKATPALKIAIVDIAMVRSSAVANKKIGEQLLKIQNDINAELQTEEKALRDANAALAGKRNLLAAEAFATERKKYEQQVSAYQNKRQESLNVMNQKVKEATDQLNGKIAEIVGRYAEANQITLVLERSNTLLASDTYYITDYVIGVLNKELPVVTISPPVKK